MTVGAWKGSSAVWVARYSRAAALALALQGVTSLPVRAQRLTRTVRAEGSRAPVSAAVVSLVDASDSLLRRTLTDDDGRFSLARPSNAVRVRVIRIGFAPRIVRLASADSTLDIELAAAASLLTSLN